MEEVERYHFEYTKTIKYQIDVRRMKDTKHNYTLENNL